MSAQATVVTSDFYDLEALLDDDDRALLHRVRAFMDTEVQPIISEYWTKAKTPRHSSPASRAGHRGDAVLGYGCPGKSTLLDGMIAMELSRGDPSISTFMGVHGGLAMGSIYLCGSEEQKERWLPAMARMELIGAFGLTEPDSGSDVARGLQTKARRDGDSWVLDGQKKWIGNASFADLVIIWAQDVETQRVLGFVVEKDTEVLHRRPRGQDRPPRGAERADHAGRRARAGEPAPGGERLQGHRQGPEDDPRRRRLVGGGLLARGAYEHALRYAKERTQFGKPIASFQLVQDLLVRMLGNITASAALCARLSQLQDAGKMTDEQASLAKAF